MEVLMDNLQVHIHTDRLVLSSESSSNLGGAMRVFLANVSEIKIESTLGQVCLPYLFSPPLN